jgi:hypothetical protein
VKQIPITTIRKDIKALLDYIYFQIWLINKVEKIEKIDLCQLKPGIFNRMSFMDIKKRYGIKKKYKLGGNK